jgi:RimJ/RimL family protein N-acetyltransferase
MRIAPPERFELGDGLLLRWVTSDDAAAIARAVDESLDHLKPWMPWADARSADVAFQRSRLRTQVQQRERGDEWQYGLFAEDATLLGTIGLMTRRGPGTLEIGYWLHVDAGTKGYATRAAGALTDAGLQIDDVEQMIIVCDEANVRSAAIPKRLGYTLDRVETRAPEAPGETGRMQIWIATRSTRATR